MGRNYGGVELLVRMDPRIKDLSGSKTFRRYTSD